MGEDFIVPVHCCKIVHSSLYFQPLKLSKILQKSARIKIAVIYWLPFCLEFLCTIDLMCLLVNLLKKDTSIHMKGYS